MSEYDILLKPTRLKEQWFEVPHITTCGKNKQIVKTWNDVIECAKDFEYTISTDSNIISKKTQNDVNIYLTQDKDIFVNNVFLTKLDYNKMILFILLIENKL